MRWPRERVFPTRPQTAGVEDVRLLTRIVAGMSLAELLALLTTLLQPRTRLYVAGAILWRVFQKLEFLTNTEIDEEIARLAGCGPRQLRKAREIYAKTTCVGAKDRREGKAR